MIIRSKNIWLAALMLAAVFFSSSCTSNKDTEGDVIVTSDYVVAESNVTIGANTTVKVVEVNANCKWRVSDIAGAWEGFALDKMEGDGVQNITIETPKNDKEEEREAVITLENEGKTIRRTITVKQNAGDLEIELSVSTNKIDSLVAQGDKRTITVKGNMAWNVQVPAEDNWCIPDRLDGNGEQFLTIQVQPNQKNEERRTNVTITSSNRRGDKMTEYITVIQYAAPLPSPTISSATVGSDNKSITVKASFSSMYDVTEYGYSYYDDRKPEPNTGTMVLGSNGSTSKDFEFTINNLEDGRTYHISVYAVSVVGRGTSDDYPITISGSTPGIDDNTSPSLSRKK